MPGVGCADEATSALGAELFWEARHGRPDGVRALADKGAPIDWAHPEDGRTALCVAAGYNHADTLSVLLDAGANLELQDFCGYTPLTLAAIEGSVEAIERLVAAGANVEAVDMDGLSPLMHAAAAGQTLAVTTLLRTGATLKIGKCPVGAAELAATQGHTAIVKAVEEEEAARQAATEKAAAEKAAAERAAAQVAAAEKRAAEQREAAMKAEAERAERETAAAAAAEKAEAARLERAEAAAAAAEEAQALIASATRIEGQPPPKVARTRMAAPEAGQFAPTRLEVNQDGDDVVVKLHATEIVRLRPSGELTLSSGGWRTVSILEAINGSVT